MFFISINIFYYFVLYNFHIWYKNRKGIHFKQRSSYSYLGSVTSCEDSEQTGQAPEIIGERIIGLKPGSGSDTGQWHQETFGPLRDSSRARNTYLISQLFPRTVCSDIKKNKNVTCLCFKKEEEIAYSFIYQSSQTDIELTQAGICMIGTTRWEDWDLWLGYDFEVCLDMGKRTWARQL